VVGVTLATCRGVRGSAETMSECDWAMAPFVRIALQDRVLNCTAPVMLENMAVMSDGNYPVGLLLFGHPPMGGQPLAPTLLK